ILPEHVEAAREVLIERRDTHLDSLVERLREERVRRIVEPILVGELLPRDVYSDDVAYCQDLGLVRSGPSGLEIANPIYREVIPRALAWVLQQTLPIPRAPYIAADGTLRFEKLIGDFLTFWKEHGEFLLKGENYPEAAPHLVLMAYLQRVVNAGGVIEREYAVGMGRMDLLIRWRHPGGEQREAIEIKVWRTNRPDPLLQGLAQLSGYLERLGLDEGTLVIFDRGQQAPPLPDRASLTHIEHAGRPIRLLRL
ncbi:MAG: ATP-binding protein, partial [Candidatus Schekmanbacteria bacterium]|nr:ATP-binding protein [Candidatus Schekmanbacteria bacterium]